MLLLAMGPVMTAVLSLVLIGVLWWLLTLATFLPPMIQKAFMVIFTIAIVIVVVRFVLTVFPEIARI